MRGLDAVARCVHAGRCTQDMSEAHLLARLLLGIGAGGLLPAAVGNLLLGRRGLLLRGRVARRARRLLLVGGRSRGVAWLCSIRLCLDWRWVGRKPCTCRGHTARASIGGGRLWGTIPARDRCRHGPVRRGSSRCRLLRGIVGRCLLLRGAVCHAACRACALRGRRSRLLHGVGSSGVALLLHTLQASAGGGRGSWDEGFMQAQGFALLSPAALPCERGYQTGCGATTHLWALLGTVCRLLLLLLQLLLWLLLLLSTILARTGQAVVGRLLHAGTCVLEAASCRGSALYTSLLLLVAARTIRLLLDARAALHLWSDTTYGALLLCMDAQL